MEKKENTTPEVSGADNQKVESEKAPLENKGKEKKQNNALNARARIAMRANKSKATVESELDPDEESMIAKSSFAKRSTAMQEELDTLHTSIDTAEAEREVDEAIKKSEYSDHIDSDAVKTLALDPKYAHVDMEDLILISLKDELPTILADKAQEQSEKIESTQLPSTTSSTSTPSVANMSPAEYAKNREKILASHRK